MSRRYAEGAGRAGMSVRRVLATLRRWIANDLRRRRVGCTSCPHALHDRRECHCIRLVFGKLA